MKTLLCLMLLACACRAQTLKWNVETPASTFQPTSAQLYHGRADSLGNLGVVVNYFNNDTGGGGSKFFWYSSAGKLLTSDETPAGGLRLSCVISVCATSVVVELLDSSDNRVLRKYQRRGGTVIQKDTPLEPSEYLSNDVVNTGIESDDGRAFYVISNGATSVRIKRYLR